MEQSLNARTGDPGAPTINFPIPDAWADAGSDTPPTAYWAIIDNGPEAAKYTPSIVATLSKLVGKIDPQKILDNAAGETKNLPGFKPMGDGDEGTFADSPAFQLGGTWVQDGQTKAVAQKTVVIEGPDDNTVYLLRLNADCLEDQIDKQKVANKQIEDQIAALKDRLRADVCTAKDPLGKNPPGSTPAPEGTLPDRKT